ncbi:hypothetical protein HPULCUR_005622 [Helicostylum pulchrum]|uniref:ASX DEUBAD domain-containing protein n=1 Tax=Helicostylum pulchrum TaxID=562976 RepID=A0ABP9Y1K4_9FUNG
MYRRSSRLANRNPLSSGSNQDLTSIGTTKKHVSKVSAQERVSSGAAQNPAPVISTKESESSGSAQKITLVNFTEESLPSGSEKTPLSEKLTPGRISHDLFPEPFSEFPIVTSSTQMPTTQGFTENPRSRLAQQDYESDLSNQDLTVSSQLNQNPGQETTSLSVAGSTSSPNEIVDCASAAFDLSLNEKIGAIKITDKGPTPTRSHRNGDKRANTAPGIKLRELRKRICKVDVNYCENLKRNKPANPAKKSVEKNKAKNKQAVSLKGEKDVGSSSTKEEDENEAGNMPKRKVQRIGKGKEKEVPVKKDDNEEVASTEEEIKLNRLLTSRDSFLTTVDMKELIPQWLEALPEEDRFELATLLPDSDCEVKDGKFTIREGFGDSSTSRYLYEAAAQWQTVIALGGFEKDNHEPEGQASTDPFKDDNYEENWGDRVRRNQKAKTKGGGRSKKSK